jgi:hypothetical protein
VRARSVSEYSASLGGPSGAAERNGDWQEEAAGGEKNTARRRRHDAEAIFSAASLSSLSRYQKDDVWVYTDRQTGAKMAFRFVLAVRRVRDANSKYPVERAHNLALAHNFHCSWGDATNTDIS